jgi:hypothetical protein
VTVRRPDGSTGWFKAAPDHLLFVETGDAVATLSQLTGAALQRRNVIEDIELANIAQDRDERFTLVVEPARVMVGDEEIQLFVRFDEVDPP